MGEVIEMPKSPANEGNGAREVIAKFCRNDETGELDFERGDNLLMWLWGQGFKVVPVENTTEIARLRGALANIAIMSPHYVNGDFEDIASFVQRIKQSARDCIYPII